MNTLKENNFKKLNTYQNRNLEMKELENGYESFYVESNLTFLKKQLKNSNIFISGQKMDLLLPKIEKATPLKKPEPLSISEKRQRIHHFYNNNNTVAELKPQNQDNFLKSKNKSNLSSLPAVAASNENNINTEYKLKKFNVNNQMDSNNPTEQNISNPTNDSDKLPEIEMKPNDNIKSPKVHLKPDTFKLPVYNAPTTLRDIGNFDFKDSYRKFKRLGPINKLSDGNKSEENLTHKANILKFEKLDKKISKFNSNNHGGDNQSGFLFGSNDDDGLFDNDNQHFNFIDAGIFESRSIYKFSKNRENNSSSVISNSEDFPTPTVNAIKLAQPEITKAKLKCKTPIHYSTDEILRDLKTPLHIKNSGRWSPIKIRPNKTAKLHQRFKINESYKAIFNQLDEDKDGHLQFDLVKNEYCKNLDQSQVSFFYQIYDVLSEATYFGLQEFSSFVQIIEEFKKLDYKSSGFYWDYFISSDFEDYKKELKEFIKLIDAIDFSKDICVEDIIKLRVKNFDPFKSSINANSSKTFKETNKINTQLNHKIVGDTLEIKMINYILLIPLFIYLESLFKNKAIFQRQKNSILNLKEATNFHSFNKRHV